jgi:hypothetical protein
MAAKPVKCAGCERPIADINTGSSKQINNKWYCSLACWRKHHARG